MSQGRSDTPQEQASDVLLDDLRSVYGWLTGQGLDKSAKVVYEAWRILAWHKSAASETVPTDSPRWKEIDELCEGRSKIDLAEIILRERAARTETVTIDQGTEKLLRDLLDRGYKMHVMAGTTTRLSVQDGDQNDPLLAWLSDVRSVLYGKTRATPEAPK